MPAKRTEAEALLQQKVRVLSKLYNMGCKTEKQIMSITMEDALKIKGVTVQDLRLIMELQKQVKAHTLYSYLGGGGTNEQPQHQSN